VLRGCDRVRLGYDGHRVVGVVACALGSGRVERVVRVEDAGDDCCLGGGGFDEDDRRHFDHLHLALGGEERPAHDPSTHLPRARDAVHFTHQTVLYTGDGLRRISSRRTSVPTYTIGDRPAGDGRGFVGGRIDGIVADFDEEEGRWCEAAEGEWE